jgi:hypothetical protein
MNEMTTKIGLNMTDFMPDVDSFDQDNHIPCFDSTPSLTLPLAEGLNDTGIKDAATPKMTAKNGLNLTAFLMDDDPTSQDDITLLSIPHFNTVCSPIPLISAHPKNIGIEYVPMRKKHETEIDQLFAR